MSEMPSGSVRFPYRRNVDNVHRLHEIPFSVFVGTAIFVCRVGSPLFLMHSRSVSLIETLYMPILCSLGNAEKHCDETDTGN